MSVLLIDFGSVFWRQWHGSAEADLGHAARGSLQQVQLLAAKFGDEGVAVCLDSPSSTRRLLWPQYKANRPPKDALALEQLHKAEALVSEHGYACYRHDGAEADDVIAALADCDEVVGSHRVVIATADKDLGQLVDPVCALWHLGRQQIIYSLADALSMLGITEPGIDAAQVTAVMYVDTLALMGDTSDNVPGVAGIGPKRAWDLVRRYGGIDGLRDAVSAQVLADADTPFTPKQLAALVDAFERPDCPLALSRRLVDLHNLDLEMVSAIAGGAARMFRTETTTMTSPLTETVTIDTEPEVILEPQAHDDAVIGRLEASVNDAIARNKPAPRQTAALSFERSLEPQDSRSAYGLAKVVVASRMFSAYGTPEAAMLVMMAGREFGLGAMASLRSFHIVEGKPTMSAQAMMARCLEHPACKLFRVVRSKCTHETAVVEVQRHGWSGPEVYTWTIDDAKRAGLVGKQNWSKYPRDMLINRCIAEASRFAFPEVMAGVYSPEEF